MALLFRRDALLFEIGNGVQAAHDHDAGLVDADEDFPRRALL